MYKTVSNNRNETVALLRDKGLTYAEIGKRLGITKQYAWYLLNGQNNRKYSAVHNPDSLLTVNQAARILNIHANTIRRWCDKGMLKAYRIGPRKDRRINRKDIEKMLA